MTTEIQLRPAVRFAQSFLPWVVAALAFALYLVTLNHWFTINSLPFTAKVARWDWQPMVHQPLLFLLTAPFRLLPHALIPLALNAFMAGCGALTLALLARSAALLPFDRLPEQRLLIRSEQGLLAQSDCWVPPVLAVVACGLQLSFWEHSTSATGEMLDLLLFAYVVRCFLEYRLANQRSWLERAALVFGLGMANNWAMICYSPLFMAALIWVRRLRFFQARFLLRTALFGAAGFSFCFLLPLVNSLTPDSGWDFVSVLRTNLGTYKGIIQFVAQKVVGEHRSAALVLASTSLLPLLVMSISWPTFSGDSSAVSLAIKNFAFHISHGFLLGVCLWTAFDPPFSPRQITPREFGFALPLLTFYFLSALSAAYFAGYFLLLFGPRSRGNPYYPILLRRSVRWIIPKLIFLLVLLTSLGLIYKNAPAVRVANLPMLKEFGQLQAKSLPPEGAIVLSDDPMRLYTLRASLDDLGLSDRYVPVETQVFPFAEYRIRLERKWPRGFVMPADNVSPLLASLAAIRTNAPLNPMGMLQLLGALSQSNRVCYLHPSFGYYFEHFFLQPRGLVYDLKRCPTNSFSPPPFPAADMEASRKFWDGTRADVLAPLERCLDEQEHPASKFRQAFAKRLHLKLSAPAQAQILGRWYSTGQNYWGVALQRSRLLQEAKTRFDEALQLYPDNLPANVNIKCNSNLVAGAAMTVDRSRAIEDQFGKYRKWDQIMGENGPLDDPTFCFHLGRAYGEGHLLRQAGQQFERVKTLSPADITTRRLLGQLYMFYGLSENAERAVEEIRSLAASAPLSANEQIELAFLEAGTCFAKTNLAKSSQILQSLLATHPDNDPLTQRVLGAFLAYGNYSNALGLVNQQLLKTPEDVAWLINKGYLHIKLGEFTNAIGPLNRALSITNNESALFNRAIANLSSDHLEAAQADYLQLQKKFPAAYQISYGLGEISYRKKDTNAAIQYYQSYLSTAPVDSDEAQMVSTRLRALQEGFP